MKLIFANPLELTAAAGWVAFAINAIAEDGIVIWFDGVPLVAVYATLAFLLGML